MAPALQSLLGFCLLLLLAWAVSENRRRLAWRTVLAGVGLQLLLAALFLKISLFKHVFMALNDMVNAIEKATQGGTAFVFGYLGEDLRRLPRRIRRRVLSWPFARCR